MLGNTLIRVGVSTAADTVTVYMVRAGECRSSPFTASMHVMVEV